MYICIYWQYFFINTNFVEHNNFLEAIHIRNMQPTLNRIDFSTSANVLKCL